MTKSLYTLRTSSLDEDAFTIAKFNSDLDCESSYTVDAVSCDCPQGERLKTCRHQKMVPMFLALNRQNTEYFLDFDTLTWHRPLAPSYEVEYHNVEVMKRDKLKEAQAKARQDLEVIPDPRLEVAAPPSLTATSTPPAAAPVPASVAGGALPLIKRRSLG